MTSFDRAADFYDATRGLPDDVGTALTEVLTAELAPRGPVLEIGVGTGLIALPLHGRGLRLLGADIAPAMLDRLVAKAGGIPFPLLLADATRLPMADAVVDAVLARHVLHLIPQWPDVVEEAMRVLRPGGSLLVDFAGAPAAPWSAATEAVFARHGIVRRRDGAQEPEEVADQLGSRASRRPLAPVRQQVSRTLAQDLFDWEHQTHSWTWPYTTAQLRAACDDVRRWADGEGWPLDEEVELERVIQWWAFDRTA